MRLDLVGYPVVSAKGSLSDRDVVRFVERDGGAVDVARVRFRGRKRPLTYPTRISGLVTSVEGEQGQTVEIVGERGGLFTCDDRTGVAFEGELQVGDRITFSVMASDHNTANITLAREASMHRAIMMDVYNDARAMARESPFGGGVASPASPARWSGQHIEERQMLHVSFLASAEVVIDEHGAIFVSTQVDIADAGPLTQYCVRRLDGDGPVGLPRARIEELQGKRVDVALIVDRIDVLTHNGTPLTEQSRAAAATPETAIHDVAAISVFAPMLGEGTLLRLEGAYAYVSRSRRVMTRSLVERLMTIDTERL